MPVVLLVVLFAVLCSALAYLIYYRLIADIGPTKALTVTFLIPVFAMAWGLLFLREQITLSMAGGGRDRPCRYVPGGRAAMEFACSEEGQFVFLNV